MRELVQRVEEKQEELTAQLQQQQHKSSVLLHVLEQQQMKLQAAIAALAAPPPPMLQQQPVQQQEQQQEDAPARPKAGLGLSLNAILATQLQRLPLATLLAGQPEQQLDPMPPWTHFEQLAERDPAAAAALAVARSHLPPLMRLPARGFIEEYLRTGSMPFALAERAEGQPEQGRWPFYGLNGSCIVALDEGGAPLVPLPSGYAIVAGSERLLDVLPFLRLCLYRQLVRVVVRRVGAAKGAGTLRQDMDGDGSVRWATQLLGAPWSAHGYSVCLPVLWAVLATGIGPAHTQRDKLPYQIGFAGSIW